MAGIDLENTRIGVIPTAGMSIQAGEFTNAGDGTVYIPTGFTQQVWGFAGGDLTDDHIGIARSLCEGPTIRMRMTDSTGMTTVTYFALGW